MLLYDDQMAVAKREDASAVLLAPSLVYDTCVDDVEWRAACAAGGQDIDADWSVRKCTRDLRVPCPTMGLITVFGSARQWRELPWQPRDWLDGRPRVMGDFCIRRSQLANETPPDETTGHSCARTPGCMDC